MSMVFEFDGVGMPIPSGLAYQISDVYSGSTTRNASGGALLDRVARKVKYTLKWANLSDANFRMLLNASKNVTHVLKTYDPETGAVRQWTVYTGDLTGDMYTWNNGSPIWQNVKIPCIEV